MPPGLPLSSPGGYKYHCSATIGSFGRDFAPGGSAATASIREPATSSTCPDISKADFNGIEIRWSVRPSVLPNIDISFDLPADAGKRGGVSLLATRPRLSCHRPLTT